MGKEYDGTDSTNEKSLKEIQQVNYGQTNVPFEKKKLIVDY